jgi:hypothetical protein
MCPLVLCGQISGALGMVQWRERENYFSGRLGNQENF